MKKLLILLTGSLFTTITLQAQHKQSKFFAEVTGGPSFALGKFGDKNYHGFIEDDPAGRAKTGLAAQLALGYYINRSVGILLLSGYSVHKQNTSGYRDYIKSSFETAYPGFVMNNVDVHTNSWKLTKLMAGGFFVTPLTESSTLALITKITAGVCKTAIPGYRYGYAVYFSSMPSSGMTSQQDIKLPWTFCYQVSVGLKYKLKENLHVILDINSFNSTPSKEKTFLTSPPTTIGQPAMERKNVKYKIGELNTLLGIGFDF